MNSDIETTPNEALSDEQRLALLEKSSRLDRIVLIVLGVVLIMILASWSTWGLVSFLGAEEESASSQIEALQTRVETSAKQVEDLKLQLDKLRTTASSTPAPTAPAIARDNDPESLRQIAKVLLSQELSFQHSLTALKAGMRDLAGMIAGSRSWLDDYNEALDKSLNESRERVQALQSLLTGKSTAPTAQATP
ncbi:hypothetical protein D9M68_746630 [compost metagenome]